MRLIFIRHGEPDYESDKLNEKGMREAQLLAPRMVKEGFDECYCSPMGRALLTAEPFLKATGKKPIICDWLQEFEHPVILENGEPNNICWDLIPPQWMNESCHFERDSWFTSRITRSGDLERYAAEVYKGFEGVLADNGYVHKEGILYDVTDRNHKTLVFVCHFGIMSVILGHLLGFSPVQLWHTTSATCASYTELYTEEMVPGTAIFRMHSYGDISHLYVANEPPSFNPRLTECAGDAPKRTYHGKSY